MAVALANATECAARSTVLKVTQVESSRGFVVWQALVDGCVPKSSIDPATALQPSLATPIKVQGRKGIETKAHSMVMESGRVRASIQSD